jgi:DNA-directed RNA polymerase subunit RPC12/RpoP
MSTIQSFHCPTCGAPLVLKESTAIIHCSYCSNPVIVPESFRQPNLQQDYVTKFGQVNLVDINLLAANDKKIQAIQQLRQESGLGLTEAKTLVDALLEGDDQTVLSIMKAGANSSSTGQTTVSLSPVKAKTAAKVMGVAGASAGCGAMLLVSFILLLAFVPILYGLSTDGGPLSAFMSKLNPRSYASVDLTQSGEGSGPGQFNDPRAIAVDREGNFFVADYMTGRVQSFDSQGSFRWLVNLGNKVTIQSMAVGNGDVLYVAAQGVLRRLEASDGRELEPFTFADNRYYVEDIAIAPDGRIALIYRGENLLVLDSDHEILFEIPVAVSSVTGDSELSSEVALDSVGNLYILGTFNNLVLKYSADGRYLNQFGGDTVEQVDGRFRATNDLAVDMQGRVYVSDAFGVQVFDGSGRYLDRFKLVRSAQGMTFDLANRMYIASNEPQVVRLILKDGSD